MKIIKNTFIIAIMFLVVILSGCTKNEEDLFKDTYEIMSKQNNFKMIMNTEVEASDINIDTELVMEMDMESETEGMVKFSFNIFGLASNGYLDMKEGNVTSYFNLLGTWVKSTESISEYEDDSESSDVFINALKDNASAKSIKEETLSDGTKVKVYEFTIDAPNLLEDLFGEDDDMSYGLTKAELESCLKDITYKMYLDTNKKLVRKIEVDMKPIFDKIVDEAKEKNSSLNVEFTKANITYEFSNYGSVEVTIPSSVIDSAIDGSNLLG